ncbi:MAG: hypothetical protein ABI700_13270 [Chloroflexota bacterium]
MVKTLVAVYKDPRTAQKVLEALLETGFSGDDISLIVKDTRAAMRTSSEFSAGDGAGLGALVGALVGIGSALVPGIGPLIGSGPLAVAVTAGIGAAAGALTGSVSASLIDLDVEDEPGEINLGGETIVSVTSNEEWLEWAQKIMMRHNPVKIEEREARWYTSGWASSTRMARPDRATTGSEADAPSSRNIERPASSPRIQPMKRVQIYDN